MGEAPKWPAKANRQALFRDRRIGTLTVGRHTPLHGGVSANVQLLRGGHMRGHMRTYRGVKRDRCVHMETSLILDVPKQGHRSRPVHVPFTAKKGPFWTCKCPPCSYLVHGFRAGRNAWLRPESRPMSSYVRACPRHVRRPQTACLWPDTAVDHAMPRPPSHGRQAAIDRRHSGQPCGQPRPWRAGLTMRPGGREGVPAFNPDGGVSV